MYTTTTHFYNGMEQRIKKQEGSTGQYETNYIYSGTSVLFTTNANGGKIIDNILSPGGQVVSSKRFDGDYANEYYFFTQDIRNSTMAILDDRYDAQQYYKYDIYGKAVVEGDEDFQNDCTFTGAISEGGDIYYMHARFYDANIGRFLTQDTYKGNAWEPMSQNLYTYCGNNPTNYIDPTGHMYGRNDYTGYVWKSIGFDWSDLSPEEIGSMNRSLFVARALSQVGYTEGKDNLNKYAEWYGEYQNQDWCAIFVSWVAYDAGKSNVPKFHRVSDALEWYADPDRDRYERRGSYIPEEGDLIFFDVGDGTANHVGIVVGYEIIDGVPYVYTVEGNATIGKNDEQPDEVRIRRYRADDEIINGYGRNYGGKYGYVDNLEYADWGVLAEHQ